MKLHIGFSSVLIILTVFLIKNGDGKLAPDFIVPCNDTSRECLLKATQDAIPFFAKGIPELAVATLDPFFIEKLYIPLSGLDLNLYKSKITGLRKCLVKDIALDLEKNNFTLTVNCNVAIKGTYDAKGHLLLFTIDGDGDAKIKITNLTITLDVKTQLIKANESLHYFDIKKYTYTVDYGDNVIFDIKNLFKESKELSDIVLQFLNANWRDVVEEFGKPIIDHIAKAFVENIITFFHKVPFAELLNVRVP